MLRRPLILSMSFAIACLLLMNSASAQSLNFSWTDDQGQQGQFVLDTLLGYTPAAISDYSYINFDGTPTSQDVQIEFFGSFNSDLAWSVFPENGGEGATFIFGVPVTEPLNTDPEFYRENFQSGNFITLFDTRVWDSISVTTVTPVPEPNSLAILSLAGISLAGRRRRSK